jgi:hypothetical protein
MDLTPVDPIGLGAEHIDGVIRITWTQEHHGTAGQSIVQGRLMSVRHMRGGTSLEVDLGPTEVSFDTDQLRDAVVEVAGY